MQGGTHLAFGTALSLAVVGVGGVGLGEVALRHFTVPGTHLLLTVPNLHPAAWLALALAGGLGSLLPDIDQPGSLVTRIPARQGRTLQHAARPYERAALGGPTRLTVDTLAAGGTMASALLGADAGRGSAVGRFLLLLEALIFAALAGLARWLPPPLLLTWTVSARHTMALALGGLAAAALLLATGGVAGLVHRLPGHHRGWTHAPPLALSLGIASCLIGPQLFPTLPGVGPAFAAGYGSHLLADALTIRGIPLWWPGKRQPSLHLLPRPLRVRTGSAGETLFNLCWPLALAIVLIGILTRSVA